MRAGHFTPPLSILMLGMAFAGCDASDAATGDRQRTAARDTVAGVEVVRNPADPLLPDTVAVFRRDWSREPADSDWEAPTHVAIAHGRVHVLDRMASRVDVLDAADGRLVRSIGEPGPGPGELERPYGLAVRAGEVVVGDGGKASIERFDTLGTWLGSIPINAPVFSFRPLGRDRYLASALMEGQGGWAIIDSAGALEPIEWPAPTPTLPELGDRCQRIDAVDTLIVRLSCRRPAFQLVDAGGTLAGEVTVDGEAQPVDEGELQAYLDEVRSTMRRDGIPAATVDRLVTAERARMSQNPRMRAARADPATGRIAVWEQKPDDLGGGPATLHLFSSDGAYLARVDFDRPWVDFDWRDGRLYALEQDPATDLRGLVAYEATEALRASPR